ncbi:MAG: hypothetical protein A2Z99_02260 [Treponema sp. GWB1_62_6]|nr:MAG: hypothetical protein A2001_03435 [Treponema sp. GWC1_61_84]OHE69693.1 MAG: hypothetical protein A2Z99_02260 [Treponema sp. GWB1_62_6]OHE75587.1 MAG: hypothetical protein A2413_10900 [Treponema sp. RIFOXYC1_FULL_61_9]HCM28884.1 hypothetical protein [Treponema sp.]
MVAGATQEKIFRRLVPALVFGLCSLLPLRAEARTVRIGVFPAAPLVLIDHNTPDGLFIDLIEYFSQTLDWRTDYVVGTWSELLASLEKGEIDLLPAVGYTDARLSVYDFTRNPVYIDSGVLFADRKLALHTVFDLQGKRVAAVNGSIFTKGFLDYIESFGVRCELVLTRDNREVMQTIANGEADAGVCIYSLGNELAREFPVAITAISFSPVALSFAVPKGRNADLVAGINRLMAPMIGDPDSAYSRTYKKWTAPPSSAELPAWLPWSIFASIVFALLLGIWNVSLNRQVASKTRHLVQEISDRRLAEEEVRRLNADLEKRVAERTSQLQLANRELETFAYSVAHDLRTPLRAIDGFLRILAEEYTEKIDSEGKRLLKIVRENSAQMDRLITGLLTLSRVTRIDVRFTTVDMATLANETYMEISSPEVRGSFDFSVGALPPSLGDQTLLRQVWINLIANAIKFTTPCAERRIEIGCRTEDGMNVYSVKDTGVGFDPRYQEKLFGVFQRLHSIEEFEGTGIGLSIVARIIERLNGRVWAEGQVGEGATFYFSLPCDRSDPS